MYKFKDLTLVQKAIVMAYKHGYTIPFVEKARKENAKKEAQKKRGT